MTAAKIESKLATAATAGLEPWVQALYAQPGRRIIGVVELRHSERTEPAPDEDKEPSVKLRITHLEIAREEQDEALRKALRAIYLQRTAQGTLDEDTGELELTDQTLRLTADSLHGLEVARLRAAVVHWQAQARRVLAAKEATATEMRHELSTIADGLAAVLGVTEDGPA